MLKNKKNKTNNQTITNKNAAALADDAGFEAYINAENKCKYTDCVTGN